LTLSLNWLSVGQAASYAVQVSTSSGFGTLVAAVAGVTGTSAQISGLAANAKYFWHINGTNDGGTGAWSDTWDFTTLTHFDGGLMLGWNIISLNVHPEDSSTATIFANRKGFILVKNMFGVVYIPSQGIVDLTTLNTGVGYQLYTDVLDSIHVQGAAVNVAISPITLAKGWNLIGYLPQSNMSIAAALNGVTSFIQLVKNNNGEIYWPNYGIDEIGTMNIGEGYFTYTKSAATLTYPGSSKQIAGGSTMLCLPNPRHYPKHQNTGSNASILGTRVNMGDALAVDSCEIAAYSEHGELVGAGTVLHGYAAFPVWGDNSRTPGKDGLTTTEKISFKLWNGKQEYPLAFVSVDGTPAHYSEQGILTGRFAVPAGALITKFDLSRAYPNPFRGTIKVAFDVPTINGVNEHEIQINVFSMKGSIVHRLAKGKYLAGHYEISWNGASESEGILGSSVYILQMKADNFEKRMKVIRIK
jgi:hypothetical protein